MIDRFRIGLMLAGRRRSYEVRIYADQPTMYRGYDRLERLGGDGKWATDHEWLAICCPRIVIDVDTDHEEAGLGYLLFERGHLQPQIVSHEVVHAALNAYREWHPRSRANFGAECSPDEERFASTFDHLFREINVKLHDRGHWQAA